MSLEAFAGGDYDSSQYEYASTIPSRAAWNAGDHTVVCALWRYDGEPMVGSARETEAQ